MRREHRRSHLVLQYEAALGALGRRLPGHADRGAVGQLDHRHGARGCAENCRWGGGDRRGKKKRFPIKVATEQDFAGHFRVISPLI